MIIASDLSAQDVDIVLDLLRHERSALSETRPQRLAFQALGLCTIGYVVSGTFLLVVRLAMVVPQHGPWWTALGIAVCVFVTCILLSLLLLGMNLFMMRRFNQRLRLFRRFGIQKVLEAPWRLQGLTPNLGNVLSSIGCLVGGVLTLVVGIVALALTIAATFGDSQLWRDHYWLLLVAAIPGLSLVAYYLIQRARLRYALLADVDRLEAVLRRQKKESEEENPQGGRIELDPYTRRKLAEIEQARMRRERVEAIGESLSEGATEGYSVLRSLRSVETASELSLSLQLATESLIHDLSRNAKPEAAAAGDQPGVRILVDRETGITIRYSVDEASRTIRILEIQPQV